MSNLNIIEKAFDKAFQLEDGGFKSVENLDLHPLSHHFGHINNSITSTTTTTPILGQVFTFGINIYPTSIVLREERPSQN